MFEGSNRHFDQTLCMGLSITDEDIDSLCQSMKEQAVKNANNEVQKESVKRKHHRLIFPKPGVWQQEKNVLFLMHPEAYGCKYLIRREAAVQYAVKQKALRIHFQSIMYRCIPDLPE